MTTNKNNLVHTEIGLYPADWTIIRVKELFSEIKRGYVLPVSATKSRPSGESIFPVYSSQTANNGVMGFYDTYLYEDAITWTTDGANAGDVHFRAGKFYCTNVCGVLISKEGFANRCTAEAINRVSRNHVSYIGNPKLMNNVMAEIQIAIPSNLEEQLRIAKALSTIDAYIKSLDDFIVKKRQIKEGLMQQLLTGKTAIPGYSGDWQNKRVGDIGYTYSGLTGKSKNDFGHGEAQYITFLNVLNNPVLKTDIFERVDVRSGEHQNAAKKGDLFFNTSSETPEEVGICALLNDDINNLYLNSFCFGFRLTDPDVDGLYLSYFWRSKQGREIMSALAQGATRYNLSKEYFNKAIITLPPIELQRYIANTITAADKEIAGLLQKRDKYLLVKQGMMQELLTGKTRLL